MARTLHREMLPPIPDPELAARYGRNPTYERAAIVLEDHPGIRVHPSIAALVPVHLEREAAVRRILAKDPDARYTWEGQVRGMAAHTLRPYVAPPTAAETAALRAEIDDLAERWRDLERSTPRHVSEQDRREAFTAACWSGDWSAVVAAWGAWVGGLAALERQATERDRLAVGLCVRTGPVPPRRTWAAGEPASLGFGFPEFAQEFPLAMQRVPPATFAAPVALTAAEPGDERNGKSGKHKHGLPADLAAARAAARDAAGVAED